MYIIFTDKASALHYNNPPTLHPSQNTF